MAGALVLSMYPIMIVTQHCDRQIDGYGSLATAPSAARQSVRCEPVFEGWESAS
jgi:hypothetical protein